MKPYSGHKRSQRGISLVVMLVMVSALGLTMLTAFYQARNQHRLVGNIQHLEQAFNQAEAVVATAENWLNSGTSRNSTAFTTYDATLPQLHPIGRLAASGLDPKTMYWSDTNSLASGDGRYLIEQLANKRQMPGNSMQVGQKNAGCRAVHLFRVAARSNSLRGASRTIEATYVTDGC